MAAFVGEGFDQQFVRLGQDRAAALHLEPFADIVGEAVPFVAVSQRKRRTRSARWVDIDMRWPP